MKKYASEKQYTLYLGSMLDVLDTLPENSVDAIVTDPPYEISFMSKGWDNTGIAFQVDTWKKCLRVLKPGGHLLAFNHSRTFHRMWVAIEDAGFEIRDTIMWVYGSGFPKSLNISKAIDKMLGAEREVIGKDSRSANPNNTTVNMGIGFGKWDITAPSSPQAKQWDGYGSSLKPSHEPICLARKPIAQSSIAQNVLKYGTGGINIDGCRVGNEERTQFSGKGSNGSVYLGYPQDNAHYETVSGRFPANLIHDGSDEVVELFPETEPSKSSYRGLQGSPFMGIDGTGPKDGTNTIRGHDDNGGSASRFFYTAKASQSDRNDGLDGSVLDSIEIIIYDDDKGVIIWKDTLRIVEGLKAEQLVDMVVSAKKVIEEYGITNKKDIDLNTIWYGKKLLERYLMDTKYTTKMKINSTTIQQILNLSHLFTTNESIVGVNYEKMVGGNNAISVINGHILQIIISEKMGFQVPANNVQLKLQLVIKEKENRNIHATVKPTDLMQYLVRLITPKGGTVLDPFMGSGSTGKAAMIENVLKGSNYHFIGIDMTEEYLPIAQARIEQGIHFEEREVTTITTDEDGNKIKQVQTSIFDYMSEDD